MVGGVNSNNRVKPNQVEVRMSFGWVGVLTKTFAIAIFSITREFFTQKFLASLSDTNLRFSGLNEH